MINVTVDNQEVLQMIENKLRLLNKPEPLLQNFGRYSRAVTFQMFNGQRPDTAPVRGESWNPLDIKTVARKRSLMSKGEAIASDRPLVLTGELRDSLTSDKAIKIHAKGMEYGTDVTSKSGFPYPGVHQVGSGDIPQRRFLFWTDTDLQQMLRMALDFIENKLRGFQSYVRKG
jgi:phage gpG-like protein